MNRSSNSGWYAVEVKCVPNAATAVEHALNEFGAGGIVTENFQKNTAEIHEVIGYFEDRPDIDDFKQLLDDALVIFGAATSDILSVAVNAVINEDWLAEWKKHWRPTIIGGFVVAPPWEKVDDPERIAIYIEPNMAFGTGTHNTTQLCLGEIEKCYKVGDSFLDVGTGTGILAIAVAKLNARAGKPAKMLGCDTDIDCVRLARENAVLNGVGDDVEFSDGSIADGTEIYDVVCANLTIDVIEPMLGLLISRATSTLILSGILAEQEPIIRTALSEFGYDDPTIEYSGEWIAVTLNIN